jgi:hypothetical protein
LLFVGIMSGILAACVTSHAAAKAFVTAVRERRLDDVRALTAPEMRPRVTFDPPANALDEPAASLAVIRAAKNVDVGSMSQLGFVDSFAWYTCFEPTADDHTSVWLVLRRVDGAWLVESITSDEPKKCEGEGGD